MEKNIMTIDNSNLTANLKSCSAVFVEKLIVSFGDEAIKDLENVSTLRDKRELLESLILECEDKEHQEMLDYTIQDFAQFVVKNEVSLKVSSDAVKKAREEYNNDKESYKKKTQVKIDDLDAGFNIDQDKWNADREKLNRVRGKELRKKSRHRGLVYIAKGAISATIDGEEDKYFKTANAVMSRAITDTKNVIRGYQEAGVEIDTVDGTKAIEEAVIATAEKTSKDTDAGKNISVINAQMDSVMKATIARTLDLDPEALARIENQRQQHHKQVVHEHLHS